MTWSKSVYSSHVSEVGYDEDRGGMTVKWQNGRTSLYEGVPEETAEMLASGAVASVGGYLHTEIKNRFSHRYI